MMEAVSWASPLLLIPGVGLLLVSTSARFEAVHESIHQLLLEGTAEARGCAEHTVRRASLLSVAMTCLYFSVAALAISGLCGAFHAWWPQVPQAISFSFLTLGVATLVIAGIALARESVFTYSIISAHAREVGPER